jgi:hypothetical protein
MVWALSVWQASPPPHWLAALCVSATAHLPSMSASSSTVLLTGLADLGYRPQQVCRRGLVFVHDVYVCINMSVCNHFWTDPCRPRL